MDLVGGDTSASVTGFVVNITAVGRAKKSEISYRSGAKEHDLICLTGDLGASYMGLRLLERERYVLQGIDNPQPQFEGHEYLLERYLKPRARYDLIKSLRKEGIVPTSMIDVTDGLVLSSKTTYSITHFFSFVYTAEEKNQKNAIEKNGIVLYNKDNEEKGGQMP